MYGSLLVRVVKLHSVMSGVSNIKENAGICFTPTF